ncbi:MAG: hypothetical protein ABJL72_15215 [Roseobacter sp.]
MHSFVKKVALVALVITIAGVASASQSHAQSLVFLQDKWYKNYAAAPSIGVAIGHNTSTNSLKKSKRFVTKKDSFKKFKKSRRVKIYKQARQNRKSRHASGYSW